MYKVALCFLLLFSFSVCIQINRQEGSPDFSYFPTKTHVVSTHWRYLSEVLLMSTHNIYFNRETRELTGPKLFKTNDVVS